MKDETAVGQLEQAGKDSVQHVLQTSQEMSDALGPRPYGQQFVPLRVQTKQYQLVRDDPQAWLSIIQSQGAKPALDYARRGEKLLSRFPDDAQEGSLAVQGGQAMNQPQGGPMNG